MAGACRFTSLVEGVDSSCHRIGINPAPKPAPPVLLVGVEGRVPRDLTDLTCQLVARRRRDPERGRAPLRANSGPVEGGASHESRQRTSWTSPRASVPPSPTALHNGNRLVGCRAVKGCEGQRDGRRHLLREVGSCSIKDGRVSRGRASAEFPRSRFPGQRAPEGRETSREADPIETDQRRSEERGSGAGRGSLWRSVRPREETTRPHYGLGRPRTGTRQDP